VSSGCGKSAHFQDLVRFTWLQWDPSVGKYICLGFLSLGACTNRVTTAVSQRYACEAATSPTAVALLDYVTRLTGGDPVLELKRRAYLLPTATSSQIQVIQKKSTCERAGQAYHKAVRGTSAPQVSRSMVVIKVGSKRYVVLDPKERQGEWEITLIFDSAFTALIGFNP
jgi:hypothetical protein